MVLDKLKNFKHWGELIGATIGTVIFVTMLVGVVIPLLRDSESHFSMVDERLRNIFGTENVGDWIFIALTVLLFSMLVLHWVLNKKRKNRKT